MDIDLEASLSLNQSQDFQMRASPHWGLAAVHILCQPPPSPTAIVVCWLLVERFTKAGWLSFNALWKPFKKRVNRDNTKFRYNIARVDIWRDRCDRRSCKILVSRVNFSENNANCFVILPKNNVIVLVFVTIDACFCCLLTCCVMFQNHYTDCVIFG